MLGLACEWVNNQVDVEEWFIAYARAYFSNAIEKKFLMNFILIKLFI